MPGTTLDEDDAFFATCDEPGILDLLDPILANLDYPLEDAGWRRAALDAAEDLLGHIGHHPSLGPLRGGSEIAQQAATTGLWPRAAARLEAFTCAIEAQVTRLCPGLPYLPQAPWGRALPFVPDRGPSDADGIGACERSFLEARARLPGFAADDPRRSAAVPRIGRVAARRATALLRGRHGLADRARNGAGLHVDLEHLDVEAQRL